MRKTAALAAAITLALILAAAAGAHVRYPALDAAMRAVAGHGYAYCLDWNEHWDVDPTVGWGGAGAMTTVRHGPRDVWLGPGGYAVFGPGVCQQLVGTLDDPAFYTQDPAYLLSTGQQFLLFAHELGHMTGMRNWQSEKVVGCWGAQHVYGVMLLIGLPPATAEQILPYSLEAYSRWPAGYHLRRCAIDEGGISRVLVYPERVLTAP